MNFLIIKIIILLFIIYYDNIIDNNIIIIILRICVKMIKSIHVILLTLNKISKKIYYIFEQCIQYYNYILSINIYKYKDHVVMCIILVFAFILKRYDY